tara:strand:+ start:139 stop:537 length:399 start_codon:yes stop_codon:yes gene_type:complete
MKMNFYTIHLRRHGLDFERDVSVIKEGFSWPAFFLSIIWACYHRLWLAMGIYILIQVTFYILFQVVNLDQLSQGFVTIGVSIIFGFLANDLLQLKLSKDGFELFAIVIEKNKEQAYRQFLNDFPIYSDELIK